jgi:hypothetical protein
MHSKRASIYLPLRSRPVPSIPAEPNRAPQATQGREGRQQGAPARARDGHGVCLPWLCRGLLRTLAVNGWCREYSAAAQRRGGPASASLSVWNAVAFAFRRCVTALGSVRGGGGGLAWAAGTTDGSSGSN